MSLTLWDARKVNLRAENYEEAFHDETGMDWNHWRLHPEGEDREAVASDGHDHGAAYCPPLTGWIHAEGCTCQFAPRCMEGVKTHDRVEVTERDDDV